MKTAKVAMGQLEYFEFHAEPTPTIKALQKVTNQIIVTNARAQAELVRCLGEYFRWRLPRLLDKYESQKTIDPPINVRRVYEFGEPIEEQQQKIFIHTYLHWFVRIPLASIKNSAECDAIVKDLIEGLEYESMVEDLQSIVSQLQTLQDANENIDVAPFLFQATLTEDNLQSLRTTPGVPKPAVEALSYGYFQSPYHNLMVDDMPSPAEMLIERLRSVSMWGAERRRPFHANFACLVQGSGSGKSRLAKECSAHFYMVYLCLRPASSSEIPPRSAMATPFLNIALEEAATKKSHLDLIDRFFAAIFYVIATEVEWEAHRTDGRVSPATFWEYTMGGQADSFSQKVERAFREWRTRPAMQLYSVVGLMDKALRALDQRTSNSGSTFLVVLDEARELLCPCRRVPETPSLFWQWRSWLSTSSTWSKSFFLLLDTTLTGTNVPPPEPIEDPSARIVPPGVKLLRPIFEFPFLGPWPLPEELRSFLLQRSLSSTVVPPSAWPTTGQYQPLIDLFRFSRPLYLYVRPNAPLTDSTPIDDLMGEVMSKAQQKLFTTKPEAKLVYTVAVCYRYGLRPCPLALQDTLLGSHSATLTAMRPDGSLDVRYLPEPMVGEALSHWRPPTCQDMGTPRLASQKKLNMMLDHLRSELLSRQLIRSVSKADRGGLATSVYLLHAYEEATRHATTTAVTTGQTSATATSGSYQTYSGLLRVQDWISALAGAPLSFSELPEEAAAPGSSTTNASLSRVLASGVSFTGWTVAQEPIIGPMLQYAWCHRVGYLCNDEEPAMDLVLPLVLCPSETSHAVASATPTADATVGKKRALEVDAATEAPAVKRPFLTSSARATAGGSPPPTAKVVATAPMAPRMPSRGDANNDDEGDKEAEQPAIPPKPVHDVEEKEKEKEKEKKETMAAPESAKQRGFLPDGSAGLSAVAIQVKNYAGDIHLGEAYRYCRMQADRLRETANLGEEDVLSVLCMTGSGRVVSQWLPSTASPPGVLLFVEEPTAALSGDSSTFVGLVIHGFDERLVGVEAKEKLEALSAQVSTTGLARDMYRREHMADALAERYALVCQQLCARLPSDFSVAAYAPSAVDDGGSERSTAVAQLSGESQTGKAKNTGTTKNADKETKAAAAGTARTARAVASKTNPFDQARAAPPPSSESSTSSDQRWTWTHRLIPVTSQNVERTLSVYRLESSAG